MKRYASAITLGLLVVAFVCLLAATSADLPARIASHFDGGGRPNGWMSRSSYLTPLILALIGLFLAGIAAWMLSLLRHFKRVS